MKTWLQVIPNSGFATHNISSPDFGDGLELMTERFIKTLNYY